MTLQKRLLKRYHIMTIQQSCFSTRSEQPVIISYRDILKETDKVMESIEKAYSDQGLGTMLVSDVPSFTHFKDQLLKQSRDLAYQDRSYLKTLEKPEINYSLGWNPGTNGYLEGADSLQVSLYANIMTENYVGESSDKKWDNVWPDERIPKLKENYLSLTFLMRHVGIHLLKQIDHYLSLKIQNYKQNQISQMIEESQKITARLMHYYHKQTLNSKSKAPQNWCSWHKDYGCITGLTPPMYFDQNGNQVRFKDPNSGLFIQKKNYDIVKLEIPETCIGFQLGEVTQIVSGGILKAMPHAVFMPQREDIARSTLALFLEPNFDVRLNIPEGSLIDNVYMKEDAMHKLSPLEDRWQNGMQFGQYFENCIRSFSY